MHPLVLTITLGWLESEELFEDSAGSHSACPGDFLSCEGGRSVQSHEALLLAVFTFCSGSACSWLGQHHSRDAAGRVPLTGPRHVLLGVRFFYLLRQSLLHTRSCGKNARACGWALSFLEAATFDAEFCSWVNEVIIVPESVPVRSSEQDEVADSAMADEFHTQRHRILQRVQSSSNDLPPRDVVPVAHTASGFGNDEQGWVASLATCIASRYCSKLGSKIVAEATANANEVVQDFPCAQVVAAVRSSAGLHLVNQALLMLREDPNNAIGDDCEPQTSVAYYEHIFQHIFAHNSKVARKPSRRQQAEAERIGTRSQFIAKFIYSRAVEDAAVAVVCDQVPLVVNAFLMAGMCVQFCWACLHLVIARECTAHRLTCYSGL